MLNSIKVVKDGQVPLTIRKEAFKKYPAVWGCLSMMAKKGATPDQVFHTMNKLLRVAMMKRKALKMFVTISRDALASCPGNLTGTRPVEFGSSEGSGDDSEEGDPEDPPDQPPQLNSFPRPNDFNEGGFSVCN